MHERETAEIKGFIAVRDGLDLDVTDHVEPSVIISIVDQLEMRPLTPFEAIVTEVVDQMYSESPEAVEESVEQERLIKKYGAYGGNGFSTPPDPWLLGLAVLIWQGIVQGYSYDMVKLAALKAWERLRGAKVGPTTSARQSKWRLDFEIRRYKKTTPEETVKEMYVRLSAIAEPMPHRLKESITSELPVDGRLSKDPRYTSHGLHPTREQAEREHYEYLAKQKDRDPDEGAD